MLLIILAFDWLWKPSGLWLSVKTLGFQWESAFPASGKSRGPGGCTKVHQRLVRQCAFVCLLFTKFHHTFTFSGVLKDHQKKINIQTNGRWPNTLLHDDEHCCAIFLMSTPLRCIVLYFHLVCNCTIVHCVEMKTPALCFHCVWMSAHCTWPLHQHTASHQIQIQI